MSRHRLAILSALLLVGCGSAEGDGGAVGDLGTVGSDSGAPVDLAGGHVVNPSSTSHVVYRLSSDGHVYRIASQANATPEDVSALLNGSSPGSDSNIGISRDGNWIGITTTRFQCGQWACLALVATSPTGETARTGSLVVAGGAGMVVHPENRVAIARDGAFVVFSASGGTHTHDLWLARRTANTDPAAGKFDKPINLTGGSGSAPPSTFELNDLPALSQDEQSIVFDCQNSSTAQSQNLCVINIDGTGFTSLVGPKSLAGSTTDDVHSGDFLLDGSIVFEASWHAEQVWRRDSSGTLTQLAPQLTNDNTPCALPDGRVASLWLERSGNPMGFHELKISKLDGDYEMALIGEDINDIGIGCGE